MLIAKQPLEQMQQRITGLHPAAQLRNCCTAMPSLRALQKHGTIG